MKKDEDETRPLTQVVSAVIRYRNEDGQEFARYLLTQRLPNKQYALHWEFPGGKLESGEDVFEGLWRELKEELGPLPPRCRAIQQPLSVTLRGENAARYQLRFYVIDAPGGSRIAPQTRAAIGLGWFTKKEMSSLLLTPANKIWLAAADAGLLGSGWA